LLALQSPIGPDKRQWRSLSAAGRRIPVVIATQVLILETASQVPSMTATLFSGHTDGHGIGVGGLVTAAVLKAV
jgi:hypothetical protein